MEQWAFFNITPEEVQTVWSMLERHNVVFAVDATGDSRPVLSLTPDAVQLRLLRFAIIDVLKERGCEVVKVRY